MDTFGIMTLNEDSENKYFTEMAKKAVHYGVTCYRFIPSNIDPLTQVVTGSRFNSQTSEWVGCTFPIPKVLYDRCFYSDNVHSKQCMSIASWLKSRKDIFFLGYGLPNKLELYNMLKHSQLYPYLPETKQITSSAMIMNELNLFQRIVLKPINGSQGNGIFYVEQHPNIIVKTFNRNQHIKKEFRDKRKFLLWIDRLLANKDYLVQPYFELTNYNNEPFDLRILLQKDENGNWKEQGRGIRIGNPNGIISNLSAGGYIEGYDSWKNQYPVSKLEYIEVEINDIVSAIPIVLEDAFLPLFELGIDIGITKTGAIWVLDINSKPGRKVILETYPETTDALYSAPILYAKNILSSKNWERKTYDAKTLSY